MTKIKFLNFVCLFLLASCSDSTNRALRQEIDGKGNLRLDSSNPYLAPNAFLKEEAKSSEVLKGFLALKGNPVSLEYERGLFGGQNLVLQYNNNESYNLKKSSGDWIINSNSTKEENADTKNPTALDLTPVAPIIDNKIIETKVPEPERLETAKLINAKLDTSSKQTPTIQTDKYHTVEYGNQNIKFLSVWYTGTELNATRISRINSLNDQEQLIIGQKIRIPSYLLKREDNPSFSDLEAYQQSIKN